MLRPWDLDIQLQRKNGAGLHVQLVQALVEEIRRGRLQKGSAMPGTRELAERLLVNRKTVVLVYEELVAQGWLVAQGRRGTFVAIEFPDSGERLSHRRHIEGKGHLLDEVKSQQSQSTEDNSCHAGWIDFNDGVPDTRMIPYAALSRAFRHALIETSRNNRLGYGDPRGTQVLRQSLVRMLNMERGLACTEDGVCLVRGSQMGIFLAAKMLIQPGDNAVFETLSYSPAREAFKSCGANILDVQQDQYGLIPDDLERLCQNHRVKAVYVTPHHQYPTTVMMPADRRLRLLFLAEKFDFMIVEDDYDHEFHFDHRPVFPVASIDRNGRVIYIGSMSKGLAPGLRVGYIAALPELVSRCAETIVHVDHQGNAITELAVNELMESGELKRHLRRALRVYEQRRDAAVQAIRKELSGFVDFDPPPGGLALWLRLRNGLDAQSLLGKAQTYKVRLVRPEQFTDNASPVFGIRIGYASLDEKTFSTGIGLLRKAIQAQ